MPIRLLNAPNPLQERRQCRLVRVVLDALRAGRQAVDEDAGDAVLDERCPVADADHRAAGEQYLLQGKRTVVVVGQVVQARDRRADSNNCSRLYWP